jgi:putative DNA methylase
MQEMPQGMESPRGWYSRGYLPHFDGGALPQAITFRTYGSLPRPLLDQWMEELRRLPARQADAAFRVRVERYLDGVGRDGSLLVPGVASALQDTLLRFDGERYRLHAWAIMPNHVHALITPAEGQALGKIVHSWKSYSANIGNRLLGRRGRFWHHDFFDRYVRNREHFDRARSYTEWNPVRAGLCRAPEEWPFGSAAMAGLTGP